MVFRTKMTEEKDLNKGEAQTPAGTETPAEKKPDASTEEDPLKKQEAEEKKKLEDELAAAKKKAEDQESAHMKEQEKRKELEAKLEAKTQTSETQEEIPDWRKQEKENERAEMLLNSQKRLAKKYPFLQQENDPDGSNWTKFKEASDKYGGPKSYTPEGIDEEYEGFVRMAFPEQATQTQPSTQVVEESGVGGITSTPIKTQDEQADALTRPLNKDEQEAANMYPGREPEYRKHLAKIEAGEE